MLTPISEILDELRAGKMIILVDDENRENEGDLVCAAEAITPEIVNFMATHARGYLCLPMTGDDCDRLDLHSQTNVNTSLRGTPLTVAIDGHPRHGVGTGISASDRAKTIKVAIDPNTRPDDLVRPGHVNPLRARDGGVLVRTGQTEGSVDLMKLAGMYPAAVIIEICREDGEMARMPELEVFSEKHDIKICSVEQIIHHRLESERIVHRIEPVAGTVIDTDFGPFNLIAYGSLVDPLPHLALTLGDIGNLDATGKPIESDEPALIRVHRRDILGDLFGVKPHQSNKELHAALKQIRAAGRGALVYLRPAGLGEGLACRLQTLNHNQIASDVNQPDLTGTSGVGSKAVPMGRRDYGVGVQILRDLGLSSIRVMTNSTKTLPSMAAFGINIVDSVPLQCDTQSS